MSWEKVLYCKAAKHSRATRGCLTRSQNCHRASRLSASAKPFPTCWIGLELTEGKNRQVRRMTAAIGHPTLRLVRVRIGQLKPADLETGKWKILSAAERRLVLD